MWSTSKSFQIEAAGDVRNMTAYKTFAKDEGKGVDVGDVAEPLAAPEPQACHHGTRISLFEDSMGAQMG